MADTGRGNNQSNEADSGLVDDRCGFCSRQKRPEKGTSLAPNQCECPNASESTDPSIRVGSVPSSAFRKSVEVIPKATTIAETNLGIVEIVSVREKHGYFRKAIPHMPLPLAILFCLLNVLVPGSGTLLSIFAIVCGCKTEHGLKRKSTMISFMAALLQLLTAPFIVGWIWSVLWGITFVNISMAKDVEDTVPSSML